MRCLFLLVFLACFNSLLAQKQANIWYFGLYTGLDFNFSYPKILSSKQDFFGPVSVIADDSGKLLFYTDGNSVWNRQQELMPNGTDLFGSLISTHTLIVPHSGNKNLFYIFSLIHPYFDDPGFWYSLVDMRLAGGMGDVVQKNALLSVSSTGKVSATHHDNGKDYWVMMHEYNNNTFKAYAITPQGIDKQAIISNIGIIPPDSTKFSNFAGQMKFSPDGKLLAMAMGLPEVVEVFAFNKNTGKITQPIALLSLAEDVYKYNASYGLEFSPNGRYLYVTGLADFLYQFDLQATDIQASKKTLYTPEQAAKDSVWALYELQLAPDGKIYVVVDHNKDSYLGVIEQPNLADSLCNFRTKGLYLENGAVTFSLPNFVSSFFALIDRKPSLVMPNVFTPNADGKNDNFLPMEYSYINQTTLKIYNRWGNLIFETNDLVKGWNGNNAEPGIYFWEVSYESAGRQYKQKGTVSLIR
jgi:gliding motility-associated-like protein